LKAETENKFLEFEVLHDKQDDIYYLKTDAKGIKILCDYLDIYAKENLTDNFSEDWSDYAH